MSNSVFANGNEVSCKSGKGMVNASFPDVCLSPPPPIAGPVPIPYPLFSQSSDTTKGSKSVEINGKEVMKKDQSCFKKCTGDEAATKTLGQGVITHTITGKVYFMSWSGNVMIESENAVRHIDRTTSNHASPMANESVPMVEVEGMAPGHDCSDILARFPVVPYEDGCPNNADGEKRTGHHLIPDSAFKVINGRSYVSAGTPTGGNIVSPESGHPAANYSTNGAPTICVTGKDKSAGDHKKIHDAFDPKMRAGGAGSKWTYAECRQAAKDSLKESLQMSDEDAECILKEMDKYYKDELGMQDDTEIRASDQGMPSSLSPGGGGAQVPTNPPLEDYRVALEILRDIGMGV